MKLHRFIGEFNIKVGELKISDPELINQFRSVLKLKIGEKILLCDGALNEGMAEIKEYGKNFVFVEVLEVMDNHNEPERNVILYCAVLKKENFELVVQKATETGVKEIVPLITARTVKLDIRKDRLEKIIREAAEQSGRGIVPVLHEPVKFEDAVENVGKTTNIIFDISGESFENFKLIHQSANENYPLGIWIGPEGGWDSREVELAQKSDFKIINLGRLTLRAETAAIVGTYIVVHNF